MELLQNLKQVPGTHTWYLSILVHHSIFKACKKNVSICDKKGQNFALSKLKSAMAWKKYTAAGTDQYQLSR